LPPGELAGITRFQPVEPNQSEQFLDTLTNFGFGYVAHPQAVADILCHSHVPKQRVMLKNETYLALTGG